MRYDTVEQGRQNKQVITFMYKHLEDKESAPYWRNSRILPLSWKAGRKGTHILAWDIDEDNWRRFAIVNMNEVQITQGEWKPTKAYLKAMGA